MPNHNQNKKEKTLLEIFHIIYKRKLIIIVSVIVSLVIAYIYSKNLPKIYQSSARLKKEVATNKPGSSNFFEIVQLQTQDEVETEMELVKTIDVLGKVVQDLKLYMNLTKVETPAGKNFELKNVFVDFPDSGNAYKYFLGFGLPRLTNIKIVNSDIVGYNLVLIKKTENSFILENANTEQIMATSTDVPEDSAHLFKNLTIDDTVKTSANFEYTRHLSNELIRFDVNWKDAPVGSKIYFNIKDYSSTINELSGMVNVSKVGKTTLFEISIRTTSPLASEVIASSLIDNFREARIEQQKQTIKYSFKFVDEQLQEVRAKLLEAENNLSGFKASGQIISIDESSRELINYISTLETEKTKVDLQLSDYKNKLVEVEKELKTSGYFDQSYLEPERGSPTNMPFSNLLQQISNLELQRLDLLQKRSENHPDVKNLDEQIALAKEKLASYNQNTIASYQIMVNSLEKKLLKITNLMSKYEVKLQQLPGQENKLAQLLRQKSVYEKIFTLLLDKREEMRMAEVSKLQDIIVVDPPQIPLTAVGPNKKFNMIIAFVLGSFLGILAILVVELKNSRYINIDDLEDDLQYPILAMVPKFPREIVKRIESSKENRDKFVTLNDNNSGIKESFRLLKTKLLLHTDLNEKIILITSCEENTGKTTIVANLAVTIAQENKKVLIIDCDLKKGELSKFFNLTTETPGLVDFLTKDVPPSIYTKVMKRIDVIPVGGLRDDSAVLLESERMKLLIDNINASDYDHVLIDTAPVTRVVDTLVLGRLVKNSVLVVRPGVSFRESVLGGIQDLKQARIKIRGVVANAAEIEKSYTYRYKYGYGYGYASGENGKSKYLNIYEKHFKKIKKTKPHSKVLS